MIKVVVDNKIPFIDQFSHPDFEFTSLPGSNITPSDVKYADALIIRTRTICNAKLLNGSSVKFIASATIGYDHIDTEYCRSTGIEWTNAPGCNSGSVMQYIASVLAHTSSKINTALKERTIGIIGVGNVGSKVDKFCRTAGMQTLLNDPPRERKESTEIFTDLNTIAEQSDIITVHTPLNREGTDSTFHLLNRDFFSKLKKKPTIINSARGEIIDTEAMLEALSNGQISSIITDCWENEPEISMTHLKAASIATPHIAGYSQDGKANGTAMSIRALLDFFNYPHNNWSPEKIASPEYPIINLSGITDEEEGLKRAVMHSYPVMEDHKRLTDSPGTFEAQRGSYPVRREFGSYRTEGIETPEIARTLKQAGFS